MAQRHHLCHETTAAHFNNANYLHDALEFPNQFLYLYLKKIYFSGSAFSSYTITYCGLVEATIKSLNGIENTVYLY